MTAPAPSIRDAATVVLVRDTAQGLEVYLQRRSAGMAFAAGVHVFPGGAVDPVDQDLIDTAVREVSEETGVRLERSAVRPWARWITPEGEPRRYDTRFFVAGLPAAAEPVGVGTEMDAAGWWSPAAALVAGSSGDITLWPPTWVTLQEIGACADVGGVYVAAAGRDLEPVVPQLVRDPDGYRVLLPDGRELRR